MHRNAHRDRFGWQAWKTIPWQATDGFHERGLIDEPRSRAESVALTRKERAWPSSCTPSCSGSTIRAPTRAESAIADATVSAYGPPRLTLRGRSTVLSGSETGRCMTVPGCWAPEVAADACG
ncbi:DUF6429 family protein [Nitriliruptor alkaliphilus]|uniref:DUF6429 family protein n=1 Tax=Nitriliruptor alkaliphilus TaxID=427918 RepID=UPI003CCC0FEB